MAVRALIIAIEEYPQAADGVARKLEGTLDAGLKFKDWLLQKLKAEGRDAGAQVLFCSEPRQPWGLGASSKDIKKALVALRQSGQSATDELFVFFSGHGCSFLERPGSRADVLISSDFENADLSSDSFLKLDAIVIWLSQYLGAGCHYYFIDACRNTLTPRQIEVGALAPLNPQANGEASFFILQSTRPGAAAAVGGLFPTVLLAGLRGDGTAKIWDYVHDDAMFVTFDSLWRYLRGKSARNQQPYQKSAGIVGESDVVFTTLRPVPRSKCSVVISEGAPDGEAEFVYRRGLVGELTRARLTGATTELSMLPDTYTVTVEFANGVPSPREPRLVDLYEDTTLTFRQSFDQAVAAPRDFTSVATAQVDMTVPDGAVLTLRNAMTREATHPLWESGRIDLSAGPYMATLSDRSGLVFMRKEIELKPGPMELNLTPWHLSAPHVAIASKLPGQAYAIDFSESLGGIVADPDLALWLAIVGGGRILRGGQTEYSKLARLPLHGFSAEPPGASPIYVLAGFEDPALRVRVGISQRDGVTWVDAKQPHDMPGIHEARFAATPGPQRVSCDVPGYPVCTLASLTRPNYATLVTFTLDGDGTVSPAQFLLPLGHLVQELPEVIRSHITRRNPLSDVRSLAAAIRAFSGRRAVAEAVLDFRWDDLLRGEWLDPIATPLAAYECVRRGQKEELRALVAILIEVFPDLPDTAVLAKLSEIAGPPLAGIPLFLDGLRALTDYASLPLPAARLDFGSPWMVWRGAVS